MGVGVEGSERSHSMVSRNMGRRACLCSRRRRRSRAEVGSLLGVWEDEGVSLLFLVPFRSFRWRVDRLRVDL